MHLTYDSNLSATELMQGDVLKRTPSLNSLLEKVHPHFFQHPKNLFFMVLTQSCDLVPRSPAGGCKAPYISIAPVRALDLVIERHVLQLQAANVKAELPVLGDKSKTKSAEFLRRLFNNNEPGFFYLDAADTPLPADCAAFLPLSIAIKSDLHLAACLEAKVLQLTPNFQAKLGWLVGQQYSRVGTADWPPEALTKKVHKALEDAAIWIDEGKIRDLEDILAGTDPEIIMTRPEIASAVRKVPSKKQQVIERAALVIGEALPNNVEVAEKLRKRLESDAALTTLLK